MTTIRELKRHRAGLAFDIVNAIEREWPTIQFEWDGGQALKIIASMIPLSAAEAEADWQNFKTAIPAKREGEGYGVRLREALNVPADTNLGAVLELAIKKLGASNAL